MPQTAANRQSSTHRFENEFATSRKLFEQAQGLFPNGVTHDLRHLEPFPIYIDRAEGAYKWDVDGHRLIDYWAGHGALLLGHSHPDVVEAVRRQMGNATHPGGAHELEVEWGQWVQRLVQSAEKMRFVSSGTEATLMALRLARIFTGKSRILKFAGHFHGWHDFLIPEADLPFSGKPVPGILQEVAIQTVVSQRVKRGWTQPHGCVRQNAMICIGHRREVKANARDETAGLRGLLPSSDDLPT